MRSNSQLLLKEYHLDNLKMKNRVVMASLTRGRASNVGLVPTPLMATYYAQRASAGLIIAEGTWVNRKSMGYINVPGIFTKEQIEGWKIVTDAVHRNEGLIFSQLGHAGAIAHPDLLGGELPGGPSAVNLETQSFTPTGFKNSVVPREMSVEEIKNTIMDYKKAAQNAKDAGFDGVEVHAQAGMLIPQFLSLAANKRKDEYGGTMQNRARIVFDILDSLIDVWDSTRIGIKFTPVMRSNVGIVQPDAETIPLFQYMLKRLSDYNLAYVHIVGPLEDLSGTPVEMLQYNYFSHFRYHYTGRLLVNAGFTKETANAILEDGIADLVSFGEPFIANPDLVERFQYGIPLAKGDRSTYYAGEDNGYTTYPKSVYPGDLDPL